MKLSRRELERVLSDHLDRIRGTLFRVVGSDSELDDLTQTTLIEVTRSIASFRGESAIGTWIHRIAVRVAYAHLRSRRNVVPLEAVPEAPDPNCLPERTEARVQLVAVKRALARLTPERRVVFVLHDVEGHTASEVSRMLDVPEGTVYSRLRAARQIVRAALRPSEAAATREGSG